MGIIHSNKVINKGRLDGKPH